MTGSKKDLEKKGSFKNKVSELNGELPVTSISSTYEVTITTNNDKKCFEMDWIIVNYIQGMRESPENLRSLAKDPDLSYSPYVGVAYPFTSDGMAETGHVFCFLPLPLEKKSLTGLPVHVNGLFALEQNRRHVKWGNRDQSPMMTCKDKNVLWNEMIITNVLPRAYEHLVDYLILKSQKFPVQKDIHVVSVNTVGPMGQSLEFVALSQNNQLAPDFKFPVPYPYKMIEERTAKVKELAITLGAVKKEVSEIVKDTIHEIQKETYTLENVRIFMDYFLTNISMFESAILQMAKRVKFIQTLNTELHCAMDLFDPRDEQLQILFYGEDKFPRQPYQSQDALNALLKLGLKKSKDITFEDILETAEILDTLDSDQIGKREYMSKAETLKYFLNELNDELDTDQLNELKELRWVAVAKRPKMYPECLPWFSEDNGIILSTPTEIVKYLDGLSLPDSQKKQVLLPVMSKEDCLILKYPSECTYIDDKDCLYKASEDSIFYVHKDIEPMIAMKFGVPCIINRVLPGNNLEYIWEGCGQSEPLTRRLNNILEGYTDGFAIPKEIVQNADDAGANEVAFLYDERENEHARISLIDPNMAECQGPALWAYNNAMFQDSDFKNIQKLNGRTKESNKSTIGKFGLGFCSVYNLTDVPSFYSGNTMVIFDPHRDYLGKALQNKTESGLKFNLNQEIVKKPEELVHPEKLSASLFDDKDERFPTTLFCEKDTLDALSELGMKTDLIPFEWLKERANSIKTLSKDMALKRCVLKAVGVNDDVTVDAVLKQLENVDKEGKDILIKPSVMAFYMPLNSNITYDCRPYLYFVNQPLKKYKEFLKTVGVRDKFSSSCILDIINEVKKKFGKKSCSEKDALLVVSIIKLLNDICTQDKILLSDEQIKNLIVPDEKCVLRSPCDLCFDDKYENLTKMSFMKFVHSSADLNLLKMLKIKSKREEHLKSFAGAMDFGQKERLVTRLKGLLKEYPFDSTILNELLQNADDAHASKIHFILDERTHQHTGIFGDSWKPLQGPSLLVYNDTFFTESDIQGIQDLGKGNKSDDPTKTEELLETPIIHVYDLDLFCTPEQIILDISSDDEIIPYLFKAPVKYGSFHELFRFLGSKDKLTCQHYAYVLTAQMQIIRDASMSPEDLSVTRKAVLGFFREAQKDPNQIKSIKCLYLLSENKKLYKAESLIYCNNESFKQRLMQLNLQYLHVMDFRDERVNVESIFQKLPKLICPKILTDLVKEELVEVSRDEIIEDSEDVTAIEHFIGSSQFIQFVCYLIKHDSKKSTCQITDEQLAETAQNIKSIEFIAVRDLHTLLRYEGEVVNGSEEQKQCFYSKIDGSFKFYFKEDTGDVSKRIRSHLARLISQCSVRLMSDQSFTHLSEVVGLVPDINLIEPYLRQQNININAKFEYNEDDWLPPLGSYIPKDEHVLLDNIFTEFRKGEYAAYEIYDPLIDGYLDSEILITDLNHPVYIYVKVIEKCILDDNGEETNPYLLKYKVNMGNGRTESVCVIRLYKFVHKNSTDIVIYAGKQSDYTEAREDETMRRIRQNLIHAWKLNDEKNKAKEAVRQAQEIVEEVCEHLSQ
ncbi:hypothetical protein KUTeg_001557 [Tegillarca granosa]|uniref:Sacsin/Nov domain-containing protein n=1 Tax=Tegillarca granosa TaxID=220873 RepID=A0ABQ9FRW0_TEGGR|nr:hypothetical protein KUTeg_001557 [Tegillarca granosa]